MVISGMNIVYVVGVSYAACACWLHHFSGNAVVPLMQCPITSKFVLILPTLEGWQTESNPPGVISTSRQGLELKTLRSEANHVNCKANMRLGSLMRMADEEPQFGLLFTVVQHILVLPHSNAEEESIFSQVHKNKIDFWGCFSNEVTCSPHMKNQLLLQNHGSQVWSIMRSHQEGQDSW